MLNHLEVAPAEMEGYLINHEAVADAGVVGVPDDFAGEVPAAFVVLQPAIAEKVKHSEKAAQEVKRDIAKVCQSLPRRPSQLGLNNHRLIFM